MHLWDCVCVDVRKNKYVWVVCFCFQLGLKKKWPVIWNFWADLPSITWGEQVTSCNIKGQYPGSLLGLVCWSGWFPPLRQHTKCPETSRPLGYRIIFFTSPGWATTFKTLLHQSEIFIWKMCTKMYTNRFHQFLWMLFNPCKIFVWGKKYQQISTYRNICLTNEALCFQLTL